jgi:hypothetical protein
MRGAVIQMIFFLMFILPMTVLYPMKSDDKIADEIIDILIKEYGNYKDKSSLEKIVLSISKKPYMESLSEWRKNYHDLSNIKIKLNSIIEKAVLTAGKRLPYEEGWRFRSLFENLTMIGYENLQIYFISTKRYLEKNGDVKLTIDIINDAKCEPEFLRMKEELYEKEKLIKRDIRIMFKDVRIKNKMVFYSFAFDFLDKIRTRIIENDIRKMKLNAAAQ